MTTKIDWAQHIAALDTVEIPYLPPIDFRMAEYPDGRRLVQGAYPSKQGFVTELKWRNLPVVKVDSDGEEVE